MPLFGRFACGTSVSQRRATVLGIAQVIDVALRAVVDRGAIDCPVYCIARSIRERDEFHENICFEDASRLGRVNASEVQATVDQSRSQFAIQIVLHSVSIFLLTNKLTACCRVTARADPMATVLNHPTVDILSEGQTARKTDQMVEPDTPRALNRHKLYRPEVCCAHRRSFSTSHFPPVRLTQMPLPPRATVILRPTVHLRVEHLRCVHRCPYQPILGLRPGPRRLLCHRLPALAAQFRRVHRKPPRCHEERHHQI